MMTSDIIKNKFDDFFELLNKDYPDIEVLSLDQVEKYEKNTLNVKREILGVVCPKNRNEIVNVIKSANLTKTPIYPISCGKNWGFGSKSPVVDKCVVLDLSKMNRILEVNADFGYIVVEPGVTQMQVYKHLKSLDIPYFLDVTGSSGDSSVLGNTLEKGVAYNSERPDHVSALTVVTGAGDIIETGYGHYDQSKITYNSKYGIGPSLDGLFLQSNFGVVTSACIDLLPRHKHTKAFYISIDESHLHNAIDKFRPLLQTNVLNCIPHIGNRQRFFIAARPLLRKRFKELRIYESEAKLDETLQKAFPTEWSAIGSIQGTKKQVQAAEHELKKTMKGIAKIKFMSDSKYGFLLGTAKIFKLRNLQALLEATKPFHGLAKGRPTFETLPSLYEAANVSPDKKSEREPDLSDAGFNYCVPFAPLSGNSSRLMLETTRAIGEKFGFTPGITFNLVNKKTLEAVISIEFQKSDMKKYEKAKLCIRSMVESFMQMGFCPYRFDIENMDLAVNKKSRYWGIVKELKLVFDPNRIISPKRYNID